jgi:hypothetical protein
MSTGDATAQRAQADRILSGATTSNQVVAPMGLYIVRAGDWARYEFYALRDAANNPVITRFDGVGTFRLTGDPGGGEINNNFFMLVSAGNVGTLRPYASLSSVLAGQEALPDTPLNATITDRDTHVQPNTIHLLLDNQDLTSLATIVPTAGGASVSYKPGSPFLASSTHTIQLTYQDSTGTQVTNQWPFTVANLIYLPLSLATPLGSGTDPGFRIRVMRARGDAPQDLFPPTIERAEAQLAGQIIDPDTNLPFDNTAGGPNGDGLYTETNSINYGRNGPNGGAQGIFQGDSYFPYMDDASTANSVMEVVAYVQLPQAGSYKFGFRFAEGYRLTTGTTASSNNIVLGQFVTTLGSSEATCTFSISQAGLYPFRLVWFATRGGTDVEWYAFNGQDRVLINSTNGLSAFQNRVEPLTLSIAHTSNDVVLSFPSSSGKTYRIQNSPDLSSWAKVADVTGTGQPLSYTHTNAITSAQHQFYRLQVQ